MSHKNAKDLRNTKVCHLIENFGQTTDVSPVILTSLEYESRTYREQQLRATQSDDEMFEWV